MNLGQESLKNKIAMKANIIQGPKQNSNENYFHQNEIQRNLYE